MKNNIYEVTKNPNPTKNIKYILKVYIIVLSKNERIILSL